MDFKKTLLFVLKGISGAIQRELNAFYKDVTKEEFNIQKVTKGAFTQARAKLNPSAFIEMNDSVNDTFYSDAPYLVWNGYRVLSVDGTRLQLPNHKSVKEEFGEHLLGQNADSPRSLALASFLYDSLNLLVVDAQLAPWSSDESTLLNEHLPKLKQTDLLLLDRGYEGFAIMFLLITTGRNFCMRLKSNWTKMAREFVDSGKNESIVELEYPSKGTKSIFHSNEYLGKKIKIRLIRVDLPNGEIEVLCTSLIDVEKYKYEEFKGLYHLRWNEEEGFKLFKSRLEVENFSGKTATAVKQDFFAKVFMMSLSASLAFPIEEKVRAESEEAFENKKNKYRYKINRTNCIAMARSLLTFFLFHKKNKQAMSVFDHNVAITTEIIRPDRKVKRKKIPKRPFRHNYKGVGP